MSFSLAVEAFRFPRDGSGFGADAAPALAATLGALGARGGAGGSSAGDSSVSAIGAVALLRRVWRLKEAAPLPSQRLCAGHV